MSDSQNKSKPHARGSDRKEPKTIESFDCFSDWIDAQLQLLEARHKNFETNDSARRYFQR